MKWRCHNWQRRRRPATPSTTGAQFAELGVIIGVPHTSVCAPGGCQSAQARTEHGSPDPLRRVGSRGAITNNVKSYYARASEAMATDSLAPNFVMTPLQGVCSAGRLLLYSMALKGPHSVH